MTTRRDFLKQGGLGLAALTVGGSLLSAKGKTTAVGPYAVTKRPALFQRKFTSVAVEEVIAVTKKKITDPKLAWMFENCYPNTLDTTVSYREVNGIPDTFVITGDIDAMWLRDSSAQVWPYLPYMKQDMPLQKLIAGVVNRQTQCVLIDSYANAFNFDGSKPSEWITDATTMKNELHERKWEIDSLCYTIRLAYHYWKETGDTSIFSQDWQKAAKKIVATFKEQQRKYDLGPYSFMRRTESQMDTQCNAGYGNPTKPVGLIVSSFRPSDDTTVFGFLVPSNLFAVVSLKQLAEISTKVTHDTAFAGECTTLATEVQEALNKYAIFDHLHYGKIYAFEVDGFGNALFMDDANVPSLLSMPYLGCLELNDPIYQNTRKFVWSTDNPYFFKGKIAEGIGGPHVGLDMIWPMSLIQRAMTSNDNAEIRYCVKTLRDTDAGTGFMHESFNKDDANKFTRSWFAWTNNLFGELIHKLVTNGKLDVINHLD